MNQYQAGDVVRFKPFGVGPFEGTIIACPNHNLSIYFEITDPEDLEDTWFVHPDEILEKVS